jgi:membrane-bound lytic murein transglycosylase B
MRRYLGVVLCTLIYVQAAVAQDTGFSRCISQLKHKAKQQELPSRIIDEVLGQLELQPRVIELDRAQPEFTQTFTAYLNHRVTPQRISRGQELLEQYHRLLSRLYDEYGVPGNYLVAFWGLETNFGSYLGRMPTLDCLATLACDQRRSEFFTDELMQALVLLDRESLRPDEMRGSWAGAMGHTQFMPSAYNQYAIDGDGDGRVNLWRSERDALASGANYLHELGWKQDQRWGYEVLLPQHFPYSKTGLTNRQPWRYWHDLGVRVANGATINDFASEASVLVPAGHSGPAFLVFANFDVIMRWNRSEFYALAVGLLADRLVGAGPLVRPPPTVGPALSRNTIQQMQQQLNQLGHDPGPIDGVMGASTRAALRRFQAAKGMIADGYPDAKTLCALSIRPGLLSCL